MALAGRFWEDGELMDNPGVSSLWWMFMLASFFSLMGWIREDLLLAKLLWAVAILVGGNLFACLYALFALGHSQGKLDLFFLGNKATKI